MSHIRNLKIYEGIVLRAQELGRYIVSENSTVRATGKEFGLSKSTVYKDVTIVLSENDPFLAKQVEEVLNKNKEERHIRGGEATRQKYLKLKSTKK